MKRGFVFLAAAALSSEPMTMPRYAEGNQLLRPEGYRNWRFVAANYGMGYTDGVPDTPSKATFHNIFIQPAAFDEFRKTGQFPNGTMLVMELYRPGTNASINKRGLFQDEYLGFEVALKDETKFPEKWAYFAFLNAGGKAPEQAKAFPQKACWNCHNQHGAADNVFVQFYPPLRELMKK